MREETEERRRSAKQTDSANELLRQVSIGIVTTAIAVIVTLTTVDRAGMDSTLKGAVFWYFWAAASSSASVFFDSLIDSIVTGDRRSLRVRLYNVIATLGNNFGMAGGLICWFIASGGIAAHFGIEATTWYWMFGLAFTPVALLFFAGVVEALRGVASWRGWRVR